MRLVAGEARNPVWSPKGDLIVYATPFAGAGGRDALRGVRPDGTPVQLPEVQVRLGGAHRFLRTARAWCICRALKPRTSGCSISPRTRSVSSLDLSDRGYLNAFDITPDGKYLVFDRTLQNSDIVLIELPKK